MMSLLDLFRAASMEVADKVSMPPILVSGLECDSRKVTPGCLFVAIPGTKDDGRRFIGEAAAKGAVAVVSEGPEPEGCALPYARVEDARLAMARLASAYYGNPSRAMHMIGVTGTNGKTTTSFLIEHILRSAGQPAGIIGTVSHRYAGRVIPASETTPGPLLMQSLLAEMAKASCRYVVSEVSSHALDQRRVAGIDFQCAVFLNLTQDHLDYHRTLERYFAAKSLLFSSLSREAKAILNADDDWVMRVQGLTKAAIRTFGVDKPSDYQAKRLRFKDESVEFDLVTRQATLGVELPLIGRHNVYNALAALAACESAGLSLEQSVSALADFPGVPGRLESIREGQDFRVFVDFAHTPDGLANVLKAVKEYQKKHLYLVFGCGGDRDRTKRPKMAEIAAFYCDHIFVTSDNPRSEDPKAIIQEIIKGFPADFKNFSAVPDRQKAVRQALMKARTDDIVVLAGKGHERGQIIKGESLPYSDIEEARKVLMGK